MCRGKLLWSLFVIVVFVVFSIIKSEAGSFSWVGGDSAAPTAWNSSANWQPAGIPATGDDVVISAATNSPVLNVNNKINSLLLSGTGAAFRFDGTHYLCIAGTLDISGGCQLTTSSSVLKVGGNVSGSGTLDISGNGTLQIGGNLAIGTLTAGSGCNSLVLFNGSSQSIVNSYVFNNLQIGASTSTTVTLQNNQKINVTLSGYGTLTCGSYKITLIGDMTLAGFNAGTGTVLLEGSCNYQSQVINGYSFYNIAINNNITYLSGNVTVSNNLDFESGNISLRSYNFIVSSGAAITWNSSSTMDASAGYFVTAGTGHFSMTADASGTVFPVASSGSGFNAVLLTPSVSGIYFNVEIANSITDASGSAMTGNAVNQTWLVVPQSTVSSVTITLQWTDGTGSTVNQELSGFDTSNCYVATRSSLADPSPWVGTQSGGSSSGTSTLTRTSGTFSMQAGSSNYFSILSGSAPALPVSLTDFTAAYRDFKVSLQWSTSSEINNARFEIERSADGNSWDKIGTKEGLGNSQVNQAYQFTDTKIDIPGVSTLYYRLKQVDFNGAIIYSGIRPVQVPRGALVLNAYPNPSQGMFSADWVSPDGDSRIRIVNLKGISVYEENISGLVVHRQVDLSASPAGTYIIQVFTGAEKVSKIIYKN